MTNRLKLTHIRHRNPKTVSLPDLVEMVYSLIDVVNNQARAIQELKAEQNALSHAIIYDEIRGVRDVDEEREED